MNIAGAFRTTSRPCLLVGTLLAAMLLLLILKPAAAEASSSGTIVYESDDWSGHGEIHMFNPDNGTDTSVPPGGINHESPAISNDGSKIAFIQFDMWQEGTKQYGQDNLYTVPSGGGTPTKVGNLDGTHGAWWPTWSADGSKIAFTAVWENDQYLGQHQIFTISTNGGTPTRLTNLTKGADYPNWSPDGSKILYQSYDNSTWPGTYDINMISANGTSPTKLVDLHDEQDYGFALSGSYDWSPDGDRIVYADRTPSSESYGGSFDLYTKLVDGGTPKRLTFTSNVHEYLPTWSPDGKKLAFSAASGSRDPDIYTMPAAGGTRTQITSNGAWDHSAEWGGGSDSDADGFIDPADNCPDVANPGQEDTYNDPGDAADDGLGDACDAQGFGLWRLDQDSEGRNYIVYSRQATSDIAMELSEQDWWVGNNPVGDVCDAATIASVEYGPSLTVTLLLSWCSAGSQGILNTGWALFRDDLYNMASSGGCMAVPIREDGKWDFNSYINGAQHGFCYTHTPISSEISNLHVVDPPLTYGQSISVRGDLRASWYQAEQDAYIELWARPAGADLFSKVKSTRTFDDGGFMFEGVEPKENTTYRVYFPGNPTADVALARMDTPVVGVKVKVSQNTSTRNLKLGRYRSLYGSVRPEHTGTVKLTIKRNGAPFAVKSVTLENSEYSMKFHPARTGTYSVKASYAADADHLGNTSPVKTFKVVQ